MLIQTPCVASLTWRLEDAQGQFIDELTAPMDFFVGGNDLFVKVEEGLIGHGTGEELSLHLEPEHAFGEYEANLVFFEKRELFPADIEPGMQFEGLPEGAVTPDLPEDGIYTITEVYDTHVVLDGNHPLAGIALKLHIKIHDVRQASQDEIGEGSVAESEFSDLEDYPNHNGSGKLH